MSLLQQLFRNRGVPFEIKKAYILLAFLCSLFVYITEKKKME